MDLHVILLKWASRYLVLVRPWMQESHTLPGWSMMNSSLGNMYRLWYPRRRKHKK